MRSKAPLALMEQLVMLLVFALAAALCLQAFVYSDLLSRKGEARDRASVLCQSVAEVVRTNGGDLYEALRQVTGQRPGARDENFSSVPFVDYREDWTVIDHWNAMGGNTAYRLKAERVDSGVPGLGQAKISLLRTGEAEPLFQLDVGWQTALDSAIAQEDKDRALREAKRLAAEIRECREKGLSVSETLLGKGDGLGGWRQYYNEDWDYEINDGYAVFELRYAEGRVTALWNQRDDQGVNTGVTVNLCAVGLEEVAGHD